ncbi:MAG: hypothetical protein KKE23_00510 [Nanoarchaeota archaeon]|nr:hypothetical protein [Nanoarchaeota archaeon]
MENRNSKKRAKAEEYWFIDAGIEHIQVVHSKEGTQKRILINNKDKAEKLFFEHGILEKLKDKNRKLLITGKMANIIRKTLSNGKIISPSAALWEAAKKYLKEYNKSYLNKAKIYGIIELSASGYAAICIDDKGNLLNDLLVINPKCGAGSGINISRILEKLDIKREKVDEILKDYLGGKGEEKRKAVTIRADRCGVFSSSATISDKNQGIPLDYALAVTLKSEVMKSCKKMLPHTDIVLLTGRVFMWEYVRNCAEDYLKSIGVKKVFYDKKQLANIEGMKSLVKSLGYANLRQQEEKIAKPEILSEYPSFIELKKKYMENMLFNRVDEGDIIDIKDKELQKIPVNIGIDAGSTMAKIVICDARNEDILKLGLCDNHGDTVETIKRLFSGLKSEGITMLNVQHIGLTGSGRYQVQKVLSKVFPKLEGRIFTQVENYAHVHGGISYAKEHIQKLKEHFKEINEDFCVLVDIGGEDTKVSIIALKKEELFDNAMNLKCSAGTGSLMDTLKSLFDIKSIQEACNLAFSAKKGYEINATCAVFLMENAKKMQAEGYPKEEILASCNYAIVENMARTLWGRIDFPQNAVVLLHGQTMQSDPLPLVVTHRIQQISKMHCIIPPYPGYRACIGLVKSIKDSAIINSEIEIDDLLNIKSSKKIFFCRGAACGDSNSCCARTMLALDTKEGKMSVMLGGCTAVNNLNMQKGDETLKIDSYKEIWKFIDSKLPRSNAENRLVIPRSFAVSEQSYFLSKIFENLGINVYVDNIKEQDILDGQSNFTVDVCAPLIGATGQYARLAGEPHSIILIPQIDFLPSDASLGRTCTTNQGGVLIAMHHAKIKHPEAKFIVLPLSLKKFDAGHISAQLYCYLKELFDFYNLKVSREDFTAAVKAAIEENLKLKSEVAEKTAEYIDYAIKNSKNIAIVCGREYILNPGIYDSHVGKLLKDKGIVAIPSYAVESALNKKYSHLYWRNPHDITTKIDGITNKNLHKVIINEKMRELIEKIEKDLTNTSINVVQVSTFRCGPDTMTLPLAEEIAKKKPNLLIQSDAMIKELAHLENRVNTFITQIEKKLHEEYSKEEFKISVINNFECESLNKDTDVVYFPTLHENRTITSVFRGAGITAIDNYEDESYDLRKKVMLGRKHVGDSVCAPFAAAYADILLAVEDFIERKKRNDPLVKDKIRILIFDNKGTGPCRQGQYCELHKMFLHKKFGRTKDSETIKLMVAHENKGYNVGIEEWVLIQSFQGLILQGILHSILLKAGHVCRSCKEYEEFMSDYMGLKKNIFKIMEESIKPDPLMLNITNSLGKSKIAATAAKYFCYGLYNNNGYRKLLKNFSLKWLNAEKQKHKPKISIHIEGEAYMRAAQAEEIFKEIIDSLGFGSFELTYSPIWCYLELLLELGRLNMEEDIILSKELLDGCNDKKEKDNLTGQIKDRKKKIFLLTFLKKILRKIFINPLYSAAKIEAPHDTAKILEKARKLNYYLKPHGELLPYIGEAIARAEEGVDLFLNVAPESCMVSSMSQAFTEPIKNLTGKDTRIQDLFSLNGEVNREKLQLALLKTLGPERFCSI